MEYIKNNKLIIVLFAITFITVVFLSIDIAFAADVGNSFSGGGGSSHSSYGGSSSYSGSSGGGAGLFFLVWMILDLPFPLNIMVIALICFGGVSGTRKIKSGRNTNYGVETNYSQDTRYEENNENFVVQTIRRNDEDFSKNEFNVFVRDVYIKVQEAWEAKDWSGIRPFESEELFSLHSKQLQEYIDNGTTPHLDKQEILETKIADFEIDGKYEYLTVKLVATLLAYLTDKNGNVLNGSPKNRVYREYKLVFKRVHGVKTKSDEKTNTTNCPNCGAPNKIASSGVCEFCNSLITTGDYGWVLNEYGQWR